MPTSIVEGLKKVKTEMDAAAKAAGRDAQDVSLIAISKFHDRSKIYPTLQAGHRLFGENRVQEAYEKWPALKEEFSDIELHLVGPLQTNKVREAVGLFDVIQTVDREKLARALAREMEKQQQFPRLYIQVNTGNEPQKAGILPKDFDDFLKFCQHELELNIAGLMCIPPVDEEPSVHFAFLRELASRSGLTELSMGMSGDFTTAIAFGATHVRVGTAIFGARD